jgi:Ca2+-binding EF-hand superfamily protein
MTTAIRGSVSMLFWSVVVLALVQMMIAFTLQQLVEGYILDEQNPTERRMEVFMYYGTFARSLLSMFEITLGNWIVPARALVENVSEWYMIFSLSHKLVIGFSVVSVLTGVFIQETFKVATTDDRVMMMSKERARKIHADKMALLFSAADEDGDGLIDREEFHRALADSEIRTWLSAMELDVRDEDSFFELLDLDGDGKISQQELLEGVAQLKGVARSYEVCSLSHNSREIRDMLQLVLDRLPELHCWRLPHADRPIDMVAQSAAARL